MALAYGYKGEQFVVKGDLNMNDHRITNVPNPCENSERVTKGYVEVHYSTNQGHQVPHAPRGAQGPKGAVGGQGPTGDVGPKVPQALKDDVAPQGPKGDVGAQGPKGDAGPQGPQGLGGATSHKVHKA